ncbi:MAG: DUF3098 domain-containing protein [Flavobacteriales bacterium]|jgi:hypothetical protein|nr:DUF3098 domain-containing protein [Flavobacteriales bacterium]MDG1189942.1 DUF3098 domain-containing protein [Flavobacteriales bacterium]|tara:strand:+ start:313 stop:534 length:222 start_codon:yes stop_codon:yes gene_type:complete
MEFNFGKRNYQLMILGVVLIMCGYILMSGGKSEDPEVFSDAIFNFRRLTLSTIFLVSGFIVEVFAILHKAKDE